MKKNNSLLLCSFISMALVGCGSPSSDSQIVESEQSSVSNLEEISSESESLTIEESNSDGISSGNEDSSTEENSSNLGVDVNELFDFEGNGFKTGHVKEVKELPSYTPSTFDENTYSEEKTSLADGVELIKASFNLSNGDKVEPFCVVVDLKKVNIVAGTTNNVTNKTYVKRSTPYAQAKAWLSKNSDKKVYAVTNADYFPMDDAGNVINAFVKDGVIMKGAHNGDLNDVPESKPMLFGVCANGAQIGPMTDFDNYNENLNSSLKEKGVCIYNEDGSVIGNYVYGTSGLITEGVGILVEKKSKSIKAGSKVYKFLKIQQEASGNDEIRGCIVEDVTGVKKVIVEDDSYGYFVVGEETPIDMGVGDYIAAIDNSVISVDGKWNYYHTILGARHSLVEDGNVASTVSDETQNGAKSRVPRTAIGIKDDGKVVIVSVEDLHYNKKNNVSTCTGMNLTQLADFMRYFGCYDAANFDGGGSSQLVVLENNEFVVKTRSSDYGTYELSSTRVVKNTIMVTSK